MFNLNNILHIDNIREYSEEELFKMIFEGDRYIFNEFKKYGCVFRRYFNEDMNQLYFTYSTGEDGKLFLYSIAVSDQNGSFHNEPGCRSNRL